MSSVTPEVFNQIKSRFVTYYNTVDPDAKGAYYAPECKQICRPVPSYAAKDGATIVTLLKEGVKNGASMNNKSDDAKPGATIRSLRDDEFVFESDEVVAHIDSTSAELKKQAEKEGWVGTRVDMWFPMPDGEMLVKVQYWWRRDGDEWVQVLHDIMYMGDGTEGTEGERIA
ncbi:hypothetical protein GE09DRAFT_1096372 [Coniochaeta sp. 2T2.1]|nr:hypothetical protein GE09DRAFT_1096372 [Coniochaeta sp. 2T2.1]